MNVAEPEISILLPAFDAAHTLAAALRSVQRQTETNWECVVVDDGSRDATAEIARAFAKAEPRLRVLERPHLGSSRPFRRGSKRAARRSSRGWTPMI